MGKRERELVEFEVDQPGDAGDEPQPPRLRDETWAEDTSRWHDSDAPDYAHDR